MQPCGECRLCCKLFPVPVLDKPADIWCRHTCTAGCAIHGPAQPEICRQYDCYWRDRDELPAKFRPDRLGLVATEAGSVFVEPHSLPVVTIVEEVAGAGRAPTAAEFVDRLIAQGVAVMVIHGPTARIEYDTTRYPGISATSIEIALRHALSQDADELKELGAVASDYRALSLEEAERLCREKPSE